MIESPISDKVEFCRIIDIKNKLNKVGIIVNGKIVANVYESDLKKEYELISNKPGWGEDWIRENKQK